MQVNTALATDELKQGTIFSIKNIAFDSKDRKTKLQFQEIYPEVNIDNIDYGIILSQSCDLVRRNKNPLPKTPYITIALLEPIEKFIEQKFPKTIEKLVQEYSVQYENYRIINKEDLLSKISEKCSKLFDNRETFYFFISIELEKTLTKMFYVNLVKTFPFKAMHYETFAKNAKYELNTAFANKLGDMLSYIYGRVGVENYDKKQMEHLLNLMNEKLISVSQKKVGQIKDYQLSALSYNHFLKEFNISRNNQKLKVIQKYIEQKAK